MGKIKFSDCRAMVINKAYFLVQSSEIVHILGNYVIINGRASKEFHQSGTIRGSVAEQAKRLKKQEDDMIEEHLENHLQEGEEEHMHTHVLEDGTTVMHSHGEHGHHHSHAQTKAVLNRLSRAIGHLESIKRMVEDGRDCSEVLIQLSAVKSAINNTGKIILQDHIEHCIVDAVEHGDKDAIKELERAIDRFMK